MCDVIGVGIVRSNPWIVNDHKTSKSSTVTSPTTPVNRTPTPKFFAKEESTTFFDDDEFSSKKAVVFNNDLLPYGPGFVQKLRDRYLKLLVGEGILSDPYQNNDRKAGRISKNMYNRRTASCDELSSSDSVAEDHVRHLKVAKTASNYRENGKTKNFTRLGFKSSEDVSKPRISPNMEFPSDVVKPSHSISELKERFESQLKDDEKVTKIIDIAPEKQRPSSIESTKKQQDSPSKKYRVMNSNDLLQQKRLSTNRDDKSSSPELEFLKVAKKLKHVNGVDAEKIAIDIASDSRPLSPPSVQSNSSVKTRSPKRCAPIPAARSSVTKNHESMSDDEAFKYFFTVASYNGSDQSPSSSMQSPTIDANHTIGDSTDGVIFRFKKDRGEDSDNSDEIEDASTALLRFEFIGSTIVMEKSNISKGNRKSNNILNLAFDSNYPAAYTYVEETEADDWSPGIHLHFVDYKALCLRLKRERLSLVTKQAPEDEVREEMCSPSNGSPSNVPKSTLHKNNLSNFEPAVMKMMNNRGEHDFKGIESPKIENNHKNNGNNTKYSSDSSIDLLF